MCEETLCSTSSGLKFKDPSDKKKNESERKNETLSLPGKISAQFFDRKN